MAVLRMLHRAAVGKVNGIRIAGNLDSKIGS